MSAGARPPLNATPMRVIRRSMAREAQSRCYDGVVRQRGFGLIEILIVLAVVALAGYLLMQYVKTVEQLQQERPIDRSRLAADRATLTSMQSVVRGYQAERGQ